MSTPVCITPQLSKLLRGRKAPCTLYGCDNIALIAVDTEADAAKNAFSDTKVVARACLPAGVDAVAHFSPDTASPARTVHLPVVTFGSDGTLTCDGQTVDTKDPPRPIAVFQCSLPPIVFDPRDADRSIHQVFDQLQSRSTEFANDTMLFGAMTTRLPMETSVSNDWDLPVLDCFTDATPDDNSRQAPLVTTSLVIDPVSLKVSPRVAVVATKSSSAEAVLQDARAALASQVQYAWMLCKDRAEKQHEVSSYFVQPALLNVPLRVSFPGSADEPLRKELRTALHSLFCLDLDRPIFGQGNAQPLPAAQPAKNQRLRDPHLCVKIPGSASLIQGNCDYYHYMQDNFDDKVWGCAYRSCQTICSWFVLQGYSSKPVPSIREIQETLVKIGDKPESFIGSKKWIGSVELQYVVESWFKDDFEVQARFLPEVPGSQLADKGRELKAHFELQGTPVMIGGNDLAQTIVGVDWNEKTGETRWLILDPHYIGPEDIKQITKSGSVGWKTPEFWNKFKSYNLILFQRPHTY